MSDSSPSPEDEKPRLTDDQKKQNHIASEKKRRQAIRDGFDNLCALVPGLDGQGRSEGLVLGRAVEYIKEQVERRRELLDELERKGVAVDPAYAKAIANAEARLVPRRSHADSNALSESSTS
ncbi:hypothetical protein TD95_002986 [Thielaviopsis punctulata]|uniref:BHLH domain-containing protein n=1 Tax=Thielaviopsis punctulata TaxID=72032 RepID=A0A0F4ZH87_9PEZI|nr:hypothetical protein TD95_002986 [Thielaviopsis punctulata]